MSEPRHLVPNGLLRGRTFCGLRATPTLRYALVQRGWSYFGKKWCTACREKHAALQLRARGYRKRPLTMWALALLFAFSSVCTARKARAEVRHG